jgi:hypothetical protein
MPQKYKKSESRSSKMKNPSSIFVNQIEFTNIEEGFSSYIFYNLFISDTKLQLQRVYSSLLLAYIVTMAVNRHDEL